VTFVSLKEEMTQACRDGKGLALGQKSRYEKNLRRFRAGGFSGLQPTLAFVILPLRLDALRLTACLLATSPPRGEELNYAFAVLTSRP
jgi:hypothetical protein